MGDTQRDWDAIVIGLGGIGSAAALWLSSSLGDRVLGFERFGLDYVNGASADHSRCKVEEPPMFDLGDGHAAACWLAEKHQVPVAGPTPVATATAGDPVA